MTNYHIVKKGDNLTKISKKYGVSITELKTINHIKNINQLDIGQKIALKKENVLGFQALILDKDRNPIQGMEYCLEFAGKLAKGSTPENGLSKKIFTDSPLDEVKILIKRIDGTWKEVTTVVSGYGNKLVTLISPSIKIETRTEKHPVNDNHKPVDKHKKQKPAHRTDTKKPPTTDKKELGPKAKITKTKEGEPITIVEGDIPDLSFLGEYVGGEVTKEDIEAAAKQLECEPGLIYAIAKQESAHSSFIKIYGMTVPTILFERHWFRKLTRKSKKGKSPYEEKYPDICGSAYHTTYKGKKDKLHKKGQLFDAVTKDLANPDDIYGSSGIPQYKRLLKAYQLDKSAALQSCSWGKFQIMGFNYKSAGFESVFDFVKELSSGDPAHIKAFLKFAKANKKLLEGLQNCDYEKIAEGHNGAEWRSVNKNYASNIEKFSKEYK